MPRIEYEMFDAIFNGDAKTLQALIEKLPEDFDPNFLDDRKSLNRNFGNGFLHAAMEGNRKTAMLDMLLKIPGINVNLKNNSIQMTPLYLAMLQFHWSFIDEDVVCELVKKLMSAPALNVNLKPVIENYGCKDDNIHYAPLEQAATNLSIRLVKLILNAKGFSLTDTNLPATLNDMLANIELYSEENDFTDYKAIFASLIQLGAGIGCSFSLSLASKPINVSTENCLFIGNISGKNGEKIRITRNTPGFKTAITNFAECESALNTGILDKNLNFLIQSCHSALNKSDDVYNDEIKAVADLLTEYKLKLRDICLRFVSFSNHTAVQDLTRLPQDLIEEIKNRKLLLR